MKSVWYGAMVALCACAISANANLISNSGFESWWDGSWSGWGNYNMTTNVGSYMDNAGSLGGSVAGLLESSSGLVNSGWGQYGSVTVSEGEIYAASVYVKDEASTSYSEAGIRLQYWTGTSGTEITSFSTVFSTVTTDSWTKYEVSGAAPAGATAVRIVLYADQITTAGDLYVDGASLVAVPEPVSATLLGLGIVAIYAARKKMRK